MILVVVVAVVVLCVCGGGGGARLLEPVPENLGQLRRWPHLRYPIAERSGHGHAAAASSKL